MTTPRASPWIGAVRTPRSSHSARSRSSRGTPSSVEARITDAARIPLSAESWSLPGDDERQAAYAEKQAVLPASRSSDTGSYARLHARSSGAGSCAHSPGSGSYARSAQSSPGSGTSSLRNLGALRDLDARPPVQKASATTVVVPALAAASDGAVAWLAREQQQWEEGDAPSRPPDARQLGEVLDLVSHGLDEQMLQLESELASPSVPGSYAAAHLGRRFDEAINREVPTAGAC